MITYYTILYYTRLCYAILYYDTLRVGCLVHDRACARDRGLASLR